MLFDDELHCFLFVIRAVLGFLLRDEMLFLSLGQLLDPRVLHGHSLIILDSVI